MAAKGAGTELMELFEKANAAAERVNCDGGAEEQRCVDALKAMRAFPVTTALLKATQVGKQLRKLAKHPQSKIRETASELLERWKKVVEAETMGKNGIVSPDHKNRTPDSKVSSTKITSTIQVHEELVKSETKVKMEVETKKALPSSNSGPKLKSLPKCGDSTRDRIRELLLEALSKVTDEAQGERLEKARKCDPVQVAVRVETTLFSSLGSSTGKQKLKYRSIMFNLKDANNPDLRRRVLLGEIRAEDLTTMSAEDMASDQRKQENRQIKEKALFECERGQTKNVASTDQFKCGRCGKRQCTYYQMQTRSADEPMTTYVTCVNCNNRWKFC